MKIIISICIIFLSACVSTSTNICRIDNNSAIVNNDTIVREWYIPTALTALKIAETVWYPLYGEDIYSKQPFRVSLQDSIWVVKGSLPKDVDGGIPYIEINGRDGRILKVYHSK